jgi:hypothetical protein
MNIFYLHTLSFTTTRYGIDSYGRGEGVKDKNSKLCRGCTKTFVSNHRQKQRSFVSNESNIASMVFSIK